MALYTDVSIVPFQDRCIVNHYLTDCSFVSTIGKVECTGTCFSQPTRGVLVGKPCDERRLRSRITHHTVIYLYTASCLYLMPPLWMVYEGQGFGGDILHHPPTSPMATLDPAEESRHNLSRTATLVPSDTPSKESAILDAETSKPCEQQDLSRLRKIAVLCSVCSADFFNVFNSVAVTVSLPSLGEDLHFPPGALSWILSAYTLTFASFMLIAGTVSDKFHPKPVFCMGFAFLGLFSIPLGASVHPILSIVFRALQGIGSAMNVTSAISIIRTTFQDPLESSNAYAAYAFAGAFGNIAGFLVGGLLTARASWRWVHWLMAIIIVPLSVIAWFLLPSHTTSPKRQSRNVDIPGVVTLTAGLILFVYAVSDGNSTGWRSPGIVTALVLSIGLCIAFFFVEMYVKDPALPPKTWSNKNFIPLFIYAVTPYWSRLGCELQLVNVFIIVWDNSALNAAIRCIPLGVSGCIAAYLAGRFTSRFNQKYVLVCAQILMALSAVLFALANSPYKYWSYTVPGMIISSLGFVTGLVTCTTMVMDGARKGEEGVIAAAMYSAYHVGSSLGSVVSTSITQGVNAGHHAYPISPFEGYAASFWSLVALAVAMSIFTLVFVRQ